LEHEDSQFQYEHTTFCYRFNKFGGMKRIIKSIDFIVSLFLGIIFSICALEFGITRDIIGIICPIFITVSATMIAIAIAGLAIIVSLSDPHFIKILKKVKIYSNILFMFWYSTAVSGSSVMVNLVTFAVQHFIDGVLVLFVLLFVSTFLLLYSLFTVISLVGTTMRYGLYRGEFIDRGILK
jgi:hypothetical protein